MLNLFKLFEIDEITILIAWPWEDMNKIDAFPASKKLNFPSLVHKGCPLSPLVVTAILLLAVTCTAGAQTIGTNSASHMWGTSTGSGAGGIGLDSALMNAANSGVAGAAQSAKDGILYAPGTTITIQSIGSQNIVSNSINGSNNSTKIDASQDANNNAAVSNQGAVIQQK